MRIAITTDTHFGFSKNTLSIHETFFKKLAMEKFDVFVHSGDISSNKQKHLFKSLRMMRDILKDVPILFILGNHDLWDKRFPRNYVSYNEMRRKQRSLFKELGVHYLQDEPFYIDGVKFYGYDGWYKTNPPSNDFLWMHRMMKGVPSNIYLRKRSYDSLDRILLDSELDKKNNPGIKLVCVTHHNLSSNYRDGCSSMSGDPKHLEFLSENFDLIINGHTHSEEDRLFIGKELHKCRVLNAGSCYDNPKYMIVEI